MLLFLVLEMWHNMLLKKRIQLGAKVLTMSDSSGYIYDEDGIDDRKISICNGV